MLDFVFHRGRNAKVRIDPSGWNYLDTVANLESDSIDYDDTLMVGDIEYFRLADGREFVIEDGNQKAPPAGFSAIIDAVMVYIADIMDAKQDREAPLNPEVQLSANVTNIIGNGVDSLTLSLQLVTAQMSDLSQPNLAQVQQITLQIGDTTQDIQTDSLGQWSDTVTAAQAGTFDILAISHPSNTLQITAT